MFAFIDFVRLSIVRAATVFAGIVGDDYSLVVIEDEKTPLSGNIPGASNVVVPSVVIGFIIVLIAVLVAFLARRRKLISRLCDLRTDKGVTDARYSYSLRKLSEEIAELESELAANINLEI